MLRAARNANGLQSAKYWAADVVYNPKTSLWACCFGDEGQRDCNQPSTDTFQAPPPEDLKILSSSTSSTVSTTTPTASASPSSAPAALPSSTPITTPNPSLSTGAKAGIGISSTIAGICLILAIFFLFRRRRQTRRRRHEQVNATPIVNGFVAEQNGHAEKWASELDGKHREAELDSKARAEMDGAAGREDAQRKLHELGSGR
ncbi:MAG: hypothetical protein Q9194_003664 [Teloschistes cf. exilis]